METLPVDRELLVELSVDVPVVPVVRLVRVSEREVVVTTSFGLGFGLGFGTAAKAERSKVTVAVEGARTGAPLTKDSGRDRTSTCGEFSCGASTSALRGTEPVWGWPVVTAPAGTPMLATNPDDIASTTPPLPTPATCPLTSEESDELRVDRDVVAGSDAR